MKIAPGIHTMTFDCCSYATTDESVLELYSKSEAFSKLSAAATKVAQQQSEMPAGDVASMYIALLGFTGKVYPDKLDYTDSVLTECYQVSLALFDSVTQQLGRAVGAVTSAATNGWLCLASVVTHQGFAKPYLYQLITLVRKVVACRA